MTVEHERLAVADRDRFEDSLAAEESEVVCGHGGALRGYDPSLVPNP